jgi:hypothetical protein
MKMREEVISSNNSKIVKDNLGVNRLILKIRESKSLKIILYSSLIHFLI